MATVDIELVKQFVRDHLPSGPFWDQPGNQKQAADRWVTSFARTLVGSGVLLNTADQPGIVEFVCSLDVYMDPARTPYRSILLQYYKYFDIPTCTPIPDDLEALRAIVVQANGARPVYTPDGLRTWINAQLPFVEVSESLPLSVVPFEVPRVADGWWAVVEIWYSSLLDQPETILCVARPVTQGSNDIRLVQPKVFWSLGVPAGPSIVASEVALLWQELRSSSSMTVDRLDAGLVLLETVALNVLNETDTLRGDLLFPSLSASSVVTGETWRVRQVRRTFPNGLGTKKIVDQTDIILP